MPNRLWDVGNLPAIETTRSSSPKTLGSQLAQEVFILPTGHSSQNQWELLAPLASSSQRSPNKSRIQKTFNSQIQSVSQIPVETSSATHMSSPSTQKSSNLRSMKQNSSQQQTEPIISPTPANQDRSKAESIIPPIASATQRSLKSPSESFISSAEAKTQGKKSSRKTVANGTWTNRLFHQQRQRLKNHLNRSFRLKRKSKVVSDTWIESFIPPVVEVENPSMSYRNQAESLVQQRSEIDASFDLPAKTKASQDAMTSSQNRSKMSLTTYGNSGYSTLM